MMKGDQFRLTYILNIPIEWETRFTDEMREELMEALEKTANDFLNWRRHD